MKTKIKKMSLTEWLSKFGQESCSGCHFSISHLAKCTYKKGYCYRYDLYNKPSLIDVEQVNFDF